jgi:RAB6A-GEF complex partner protein 1
MDKGIIIGTEQEILVRSSLPFVIFRLNTNVSCVDCVLRPLTFLKSHLFIHHILRYHLQKNQVKEAIQFALQYQSLVFFSHSLEVLLHTVLEGEDDAREHESVLPAVIEFLDHFDVSLEVVVGCARKTEMTRWKRLFDAVGSPRTLFEVCIRRIRLPKVL